jgi:copper chaperone CopZ
MNRMIENADQEGRHLRFWTALEFTEKCPDTRSGTTPTDYWINVERGEVLSKEDYLKKDVNKKKDYFLETGMFDKCKTCPAAVFCRGDAKKQTSKSNMLKSIDELNQKIRSEGYDWASSQLFNLKPSTEGIIFREFDEKIHVKDWNQMWYTLTNKEFPGQCTHDMFVKKCHELQLPCFAGIDWGYSAPHTVVFFFMDKKENVYVVKCDGMTYISQPMWIHHIKTKYHTLYRCQLYTPDSADQGAILEMQKSGLPTSNNQKDKGSVNTGIQVIKKLLKVPGTMDSKIFFAKETCGSLINEFSLYHYKLDAAGLVTDDPDTENDHWIDALRYSLMHLLGKSQLILGSGLSFDSSEGIVDKAGNYTRMPSPTEFAALSGLRINENDQDLSKLGKVNTKSNLDTPDDDEGNGSGGGFLWSF